MSTTTTTKGTEPEEPTPTSLCGELQILPTTITQQKEQENDKKRGAQESPENQAQRKNTRVETDIKEKEDEKEEDEDTEENKYDQWKGIKQITAMVNISIAKAVKEAVDPLTIRIDQIPDQILAAVREATPTLPLLKEISSLEGELE